jgi:hypothetical protein
LQKPASTGQPRSRQAAAIWLRDHRTQLSRVAALGTVAVLVIAAGASVMERWSGARRVSPPDSLERRIAAGEARLGPKPGGQTTPETTLNKVRANVPRPNDSKATDASKSKEQPISPPPTTPTTPADAEARHSAALRELEQLRDRLHPDSTVSDGYARTAITRLDALIPQFLDRDDSLFAAIYKSHAYYHLGELDTQCAVLRRIRSRATGTRAEAVVEGYFGYGKC